MEFKKKILIVDDKIENLKALEKLIGGFDIEIFRALSGNEALTLTLAYEFALALIDVQMPDMDGYETVKLMRNVEKTKYLPVIFLSAIYSENHYLIQGIEAGAVDFITKPIQPRILLGKIKIFLDLYEQRKKLEFVIEQHELTEKSLKETEKELLIAKEKAVESDKLKTAFLANMSHEIRTPLNAIVGFSNLLSDENISHDKKRTYIECINNSSESLAQLINDIIDISKIEAGQLLIKKSTIDIVEMLRQLHMTFKVELKKQGKENVEFNLHLPQNIDKYIIETDNTRLRQVLSNLLNNAVKFTIEGKIEFGYHIKDNNLEFFVTDTGVGIPNDKLSLVFERFQQVHNDRINNQSGTGLGLSIVKKIVELLGGDIYVTSDNSGTSFYFTISAKEQKTKAVTIVNKPVTSSKAYDFSNKKILIAEDEYINYMLLNEMLKSANAVIEWAKNGQEAIDLFTKNRHYDLILMDIKMPIKTGYQALSEIREKDKSVPIIAQTAYAMNDDKDEILSYGFNGYLPKPINKFALYQLLSNFLK